MFDYPFFLGFPVSDSYQQELSQLPETVRNLFIQNHSSLYLQQIEYDNVLYLGKYLGSSVEVAVLDSLQGHIESLLKKLVPTYPYERDSLLLLLPTTQE